MKRFWESLRALDPIGALCDLVEGESMGLPENHPAIVDAKRRGLIPSEAPPKAARSELVVDSHALGTTAWVIGVEAPSLANSREWRTRNRVTQAHRKAVSRALGESLGDVAPVAAHLHRGGTVRVRLTRLGGRGLDRHDNLPASLKYVLDAVCLFLGVDDADPRLEVTHGQEPGGAVGFRIELEVLT